ncbi:helix-turn-helix domain-containing protein [Nocardia puris]|uniref:AraC family transcriptional activator FtrA n=1 Tax=Nocardia puris TaxID=208602 RepID=A0A366DMR7_9NOCA|nr:helix-turn-helix domain-containing protein [Nocardia puris]MBF6211252.1 helix-turn-helix domain-containing protein [Nocardia puris]MBF6364971.1 helix-turn-helix domain-containing protein [Nocardia puris]MBF6458757.1 helix-turn-helix domain-containing protein [Nocardia puris]RBO90604.1 AraC family transcriptional activator FtrA [Nocardia puris]
MTRPTIAVPLVDGMTLFEIGMPLEALGYDWDPGAAPLYDVRLCGDLRGVRTHTGARLSPQYPLRELAAADTVLIPAVPPGRPVGEPLLRELRAAAERGARVASLCTGTFALAEAGLLDGRRATTHWRHAPLLQRVYPEVEVDARAIYVDDGGILTSAGSAAGLDLCLHLIRHDHGERAANTIARNLVIAAHRDGDQAQYVAAEPLSEPAGWLDDLRSWLREHLREPVTLADLARATNTSPRTLARRFDRDTGTTPMRWVAAERLAAARELLETTDTPIERIAFDVGFGSPVTFRATFTHDVGISPRRYRAKFASPGLTRGHTPPRTAARSTAHGIPR